MKVAIVGSRGFKNTLKIWEYVQDLPPDTIVISGGAHGVDENAIAAAASYSLRTKVFEPNWAKYGPAAGPMRNTQIVNECDRLVAFWDEKSKGTKDSIEKARKAGKPVEIIYDDERSNNG